MSAIPFMPLYVADYLADAAHLSAAEHGAYLLLIMTYWQRGKPLPDNDRHLARIARMTDTEWTDAKEQIEPFFQVEDGLWRHKRIEAELAKVRAKSEQARAAVSKRRDRQISTASDDAVAQPNNERSTPVDRPYYYTDKDTDTDIPPVPLKGDIPPSPSSEPVPQQIAEAVEAWNALASECNLPRCQILTDARRQKLRQRLAEAGGLDGWRHALDRIRGSPFLRGDNDRGWRADFDFVLQAKSFARLMEGSYDPGDDDGNAGAGNGAWAGGRNKGGGRRRSRGSDYAAVIAGARAALGGG